MKQTHKHMQACTHSLSPSLPFTTQVWIVSSTVFAPCEVPGWQLCLGLAILTEATSCFLPSSRRVSGRDLKLGLHYFLPHLFTSQFNNNHIFGHFTIIATEIKCVLTVIDKASQAYITTDKTLGRRYILIFKF
jgi:hypothetical protein